MSVCFVVIANMNEEISSELTVMETDLSKTFHLLAKGKVQEHCITLDYYLATDAIYIRYENYSRSMIPRY